MKTSYSKVATILVLISALVTSYPVAGGVMYFDVSSNATFGGRAVGVAIYTPFSELTFSDTGQLPSVGGVSKTDVPVVVNPLVKGDALVATTNGFDGGAGSMASISEITLLPDTNYTITADYSLTETLVSSTGEAFGRSQVVDLHIAGQPINITSLPNQVVSIPKVFTLVINEQIRSTQNGINSITVNALHLKLPTGEEVIIAGSTSKVSLDGIITPVASQYDSSIYFVDHDDDDDDRDDDDDWDDDDDNDRKKRTSKNYASGSGYISTANNGKGEFGFIAGYYKNGGYLDGEIKYKDKKAKIELKSKEITSFSGSGNTRTFSGTAKLDNNAGTHTFTVTVTDNGKGKNTDTFEIQVSNGYSASGLLKKGNIHVFGKMIQNNPPAAADDSATTNENTSVTINVLANDSDPDGNVLSVTSTSTPSSGTATINADNTITYSPNQSFVGTDSFTYTISDGKGGTASATVTVTVAAVNDPPLAADDSVEVTESFAAQQLVDWLDLTRFKQNIQDITSFGPRPQGSQTNAIVLDWLEEQLVSVGYDVERHDYTFNGEPRQSVYATKIGTINPNQMYLISGHMDSTHDTEAADDNGSGMSLVLETARAFANPGVKTDISVRFIFWNNEETNLAGSTAYVQDRAPLQGIESPPGSGLYPEPIWLGHITHDQILYDHGIPPMPDQSPNADIDIEYRWDSTKASESSSLAKLIQSANSEYSIKYPAEIGPHMCCTDTWAFRNYTAAVSIRENTANEINLNAAAPYHDTRFDTYSAYSEADFKLGLDTVRMTVGIAAELAGTISPITINVLANDSDPDGDTLSVTTTSTPSSGTATINADNTITYSPNQNFVGTDSFTYTVSDGNGGSDTATVTISINAVNDPPIAADDSAQTQVNTPVTVDVLANDSDPDGDTILLDSFNATSQFNGVVTRDDNGTLQDQSDDKLVYTPPQDAYGTDTFRYTISDGNVGTSTATVTVTIPQPPLVPGSTSGQTAYRFMTLE